MAAQCIKSLLASVSELATKRGFFLGCEMLTNTATNETVNRQKVASTVEAKLEVGKREGPGNRCGD